MWITNKNVFIHKKRSKISDEKKHGRTLEVSAVLNSDALDALNAEAIMTQLRHSAGGIWSRKIRKIRKRQTEHQLERGHEP